MNSHYDPSLCECSLQISGRSRLNGVKLTFCIFDSTSSYALDIGVYVHFWFMCIMQLFRVHGLRFGVNKVRK